MKQFSPPCMRKYLSSRRLQFSGPPRSVYNYYLWYFVFQIIPILPSSSAGPTRAVTWTFSSDPYQLQFSATTWSILPPPPSEWDCCVCIDLPGVNYSKQQQQQQQQQQKAWMKTKWREERVGWPYYRQIVGWVSFYCGKSYINVTILTIFKCTGQ